MIVTHRWLSLVLGLVLLAITTSGSVLLYRPQIQQLLDREAYAATSGPARTSLLKARDAVLAAHPDADGLSTIAAHGVIRVSDGEGGWTVDPATGEVLGHVDPAPGWIEFLDNLHECFLTCEDHPGTIAWLAEPVPHTGWLGFEGEPVTGGGLVLGVLGMLLLYLSLTGIWLWFPRPHRKGARKGGTTSGRWRGSMSVRWRRGRFARDTDLHKVAGMIAIPLLLVWALTGMSYELGFVEKGWYAALPGSEVEGPDAVSAEGDGPDIAPEAAVAAATRLVPDADLDTLDLPAEDDPTGAYVLWFSRGFDTYGHSDYPGDLGVSVDRRTAEATVFYRDDTSLTQRVYQDWNFPTHSGYVVNGWWRLAWLVLGLAPLLLAVTGVSTWLVRRRTRRTRAAAARRGVPLVPVPTTVAEELRENPEQDPDLADQVR